MNKDELTVCRAKHDRKNPYTRISNAMLRDARLSYRARGVLACVLSHKDGWRISATWLAKNGKEGRDAMLAALAELEALDYSSIGYVNNNGNVTKLRSFIEEPCSPEIPDNTKECSPENLNDGRPVVHKTRSTDSQAILEQTSKEQIYSKNEYLGEEKSPHSPPGGKTRKDWIDEIYQSYPKKIANRVAKIAIKRAINRGATPEHLLERTQAYAEATKTWPAGNERFIPNPATWFNDERFNDAPQTWTRKAVRPDGGAEKPQPQMTPAI